MEQRKSIGIILALLGFILVIISFFLSASARREQQQQAARQFSEVYRTLGQGNGTGAGVNVVGSDDGPAVLAAIGGILSMLIGVVVFKGKIGSWNFASAPTITKSHPIIPAETILQNLRSRHERVVDQFPDDGLMRNAVECLMQGQTIQAIKAVKDATGCNLEEAKQLIDSLHSAMKNI